MKKLGVREIAVLAKVSVGTVDRALHGRKEVSEKTRERILKIAAKHGYTPDPTARALSIGRAHLRIGVCIPKEIRYFYDQLRDGIFDEAKHLDHAGVEIVYKPVPRLDSSSTAVIRSLLNDRVQALILVPGNPAEVAPLIERAEGEHNVRVVCVATDDSHSSRSSSISVDPALNGRIAAELMARFVPAKSRVAVVTGILHAEDNSKKVTGFSDVFVQECPGGEVLPVIEGHEKELETFEKCKTLLEKQRSLAGIYVSTVNCIPVCKAIEAAGRAGGVRVVATDLFSELRPYFSAGTISASIYQNPYRQGRTAVRLIADNLLYGRPFPPVQYLNPSIALKANLDLFREMQDEEQRAARERRSA